MDVDSNVKGMDGTATLEEDDEKGQGQEKTGYRRPTKRTKISASGSWCEGDQAIIDTSVPAVQPRHASRTDIVGSSSSSSSSSNGSVDMDRSLENQDDDDSHESQVPDQEEDDSVSVPYPKPKPNRTIPTENASPTTTHINTSNSTPRFTIYEDPDDKQIRSLALIPRLPENWHACPGDNKENMEDELYDDGQGGLTPADEFQSSEESDESNHTHFQHLLNINDYRPAGILRRHVDDAVRRERFTPVEFAGVDTDVDMDMGMDMDINVDHHMDNDTVSTAPATPRPSGETGHTTPTQSTPRHHNTRGPASGEIEVDVEDEEMPRDSFRERMSFLDAPPRRFIGRNGQRRAHWFRGV